MFYVRLTVAPEEVMADDLIPDHDGVLIPVGNTWVALQDSQIVYRPVVQAEAGHLEPI